MLVLPRRAIVAAVLVIAATAGFGFGALDAAGRRGRVQLQGRALVDEDGPFLALGATLFWTLWGERHEPDRLDANLAWLASHGVDYVRILGMVGGQSWEDRTIDPADDAYWDTVDRLLDRLEGHGLRVQVTLFAEADRMMPDAGRRRAFADAWADRAERTPDRFMLLEVANEHWQNGIESVGELRALGRRLAERAETLVALSAPYPGNVCEVYADSAADVATIHYGRSADRWAAVRAPWEWPGGDVPCRDSLPAIVSNEPIGPQSSVEADDDPTRLVMGYVTTLLAGNAAYVLHAGAGVRGGGGADRALGRAADFADTPNLDRALIGIAKAREYLPGDLANWTRHEPDGPDHPLRGFDRAVGDGTAGAVYAATSQDRFVVVVLDARGTVEGTAAGPLSVEIHEPLTGDIIAKYALAAGEPLRLEGQPAFILVGQLR